MNHRLSLEMQAPERYLLGELTADEAEAFELHYFDCAQCALAVESGQMLITGIREQATLNVRSQEPAPAVVAAKKPPVKEKRPSFLAGFWRQPAFGTGLAFAMAVVVVYQSAVVIPDLTRPHSLPGFHLVEATRAEDQTVRVAAGESTVGLSFYLPPDENARTFSCAISNGEKTSSPFDCSAAEEGDPIMLQVPVSLFRPGRNELTVRAEDANGKVVQTYPFNFKTR